MSYVARDAEMLLNYLETFPTTVSSFIGLMPGAVLNAAAYLRERANMPKPELPPEPAMGARDPSDLQT